MEVIIGKRALVKHCDMGLIEVEIMNRLPKPLEKFYAGKLLKIHLKEVRLEEATLDTKQLLDNHQKIKIFFQPHEIIEYLNEIYN